jgi:hypothetical protein
MPAKLALVRHDVTPGAARTSQTLDAVYHRGQVLTHNNGEATRIVSPGMGRTRRAMEGRLRVWESAQNAGFSR